MWTEIPPHLGGLWMFRTPHLLLVLPLQSSSSVVGQCTAQMWVTEPVSDLVSHPAFMRHCGLTLRSVPFCVTVNSASYIIKTRVLLCRNLITFARQLQWRLHCDAFENVGCDKSIDYSPPGLHVTHETSFNYPCIKTSKYSGVRINKRETAWQFSNMYIYIYIFLNIISPPHIWTSASHCCHRVPSDS